MKKVRKLRGVSTWVRDMVKHGPVREYLYEVPPKVKVGVLLFRGEKIEDFAVVEQTQESCIQGYCTGVNILLIVATKHTTTSRYKT